MKGSTPECAKDLSDIYEMSEVKQVKNNTSANSVYLLTSFANKKKRPAGRVPLVPHLYIVDVI